MELEQKLYTFAVVAGTRACDARCQCCISKMTPPRGMTLKEEPIVWNRFTDAFNYAKQGEAETMMITGKGEALLFPWQITDYLNTTKKLEGESGFRFRTREMQTNGIKIQEKPDVFDPLLTKWKQAGFDTMSLSIVHYEEEANRKFYIPYKDSYINLAGLIQRIHDHDIKVRLSCIFIKGNIDSPEKVVELIDFSRHHHVDELTIRSVTKPEKSENKKVYNWVAANEISIDKRAQIVSLMWRIGKAIGAFPWGAVVFDVKGQNVCLTNCITPDNIIGTHRQLVFFPSGIIATGWTKEAEILP